MRTTKGTKNTKAKIEFDSILREVIGCAIEVHREIGPGLLESAYQQCLAHEFHTRNIGFQMEKQIPVDYKGVRLECGFRADFIVEDQLVLELKCVTALTDIHKAQLLTYMKLCQCRTGLLINFNVNRLQDGLKRFVL